MAARLRPGYPGRPRSIQGRADGAREGVVFAMGVLSGTFVETAGRRIKRERKRNRFDHAGNYRVRHFLGLRPGSFAVVDLRLGVAALGSNELTHLMDVSSYSS